MIEVTILTVLVVGLLLSIPTVTYLVQKNKNLITNNTELKSKVDQLNQEIGGFHELKDQLTNDYQDLNISLSELHDELVEEKEKNKKILSQKKSSEVRVGLISEQLAPFLKDFPYDPKNVHFFGQPIDMIIFDYDQGEIVFFEIKSGGAKESARQRTIKNIIKKGNVYYEKMTINEKGIKIKREPNNA